MILIAHRLPSGFGSAPDIAPRSRNPAPGAAARLSTLLLLAVACAGKRPPPPPTQAPFAQTPTLTEVLRTSERPGKQGDVLTYGKLSAPVPCPFDPRVLPSPGGGGLLLRFTAPVPTDLGVQLDSGQAPRRISAPTDEVDEARLAQAGRPYFYENESLTRGAPTGAVVAREVALWPGQRTDKSLQISLWDISFAPQAVDTGLYSLPLHVSVVGTCPDFTVAITRESIDVRPGEIHRLHARVVPQGDGLGSMSVAFSLSGMPAGVTATPRDPALASTDWRNPRETTFDLAASAQAAPGKFPLLLHARLGDLERTATVTVSLLPKEDY